MPFPSLVDLPDPGIEPRSPAFQADALTSELPGNPEPPTFNPHANGLAITAACLRRYTLISQTRAASAPSPGCCPHVLLTRAPHPFTVHLVPPSLLLLHPLKPSCLLSQRTSVLAAPQVCSFLSPHFIEMFNAMVDSPFVK